MDAGVGSGMAGEGMLHVGWYPVASITALVVMGMGEGGERCTVVSERCVIHARWTVIRSPAWRRGMKSGWFTREAAGC